MKKLFILIIFMAFLPRLQAQHVHIASGQHFYIASQVTVRGNLTNGSAMEIASGGLHFSGNEFANITGAAYSGSGYVTFAVPATGTQLLEGNNVFFQKARIDNSNNLQLKPGSNAGINDTLEFVNGSLELGNQNLSMAANAGFAGYAANRRVVTNGSGYVNYIDATAGKHLFYPLAYYTNADYTPAEVWNGSTIQTIHARVEAVPGSAPLPNTTKGIRRVWNIWSPAAGALDTLILYHSDSLNGAQYTTAQAAVTRYVGSSWQLPCTLAGEIAVGSLKALGANDNILSNTSSLSTGNAYYSKISASEVPSVTLVNAHPAVCLGESIASILYTATAGGADKYDITWDNAAIAAGFTNLINTSFSAGSVDIVVPTGAVPGRYSGILKVQSTSTGCVSSDSAISIRIHPLPQPVVSWNGTLLSTDTIYTSYQWYIGTQQIPGANASTHTPSMSGNYAVSVTDSNGCTSLSSYRQATVGIPESGILNASVHIYPNPSAGILYISAPVAVQVQVYTMDGRLVLKQAGIQEIDITSFSSGVYMMHVADADGALLKTEKIHKY